MEGGIAEEDYDEYDMILGEILNTTYVNPLTVRHRLIVPFEELDIISLELEKESSPSRRAAKLISPRSNAPKLNKSPQPATQQESIGIYGLDNQKLQRKGSNYKISEVISGQDNSNLPDENSLTQSFEDMRIKEITAMIPSSPSSVKNNQSSSKITCLLNGQSANHLNKSLFGYDMVDMKFHPPSRIFNGITSPSVDVSNEIDCWHKAKLFKPHGYEPNPISESVFGNFSEHQQVSSINTMAMPLNRSMNAYPLFSSVQGVHLTNSYQPNLYMDAHSPPKHLNQPDMVWQGMEDERYVRYNQQYIYSQHLQNYSPEVLQVQKSMDLVMGPLNGNKVHPCFEGSIPPQFEQCYQNSYLNAPNQLNHCQYQPQGSSGRVSNCSVKDFQGQQILDKLVRKSFPEKILTRSPGMNTIRILKPNPLTTDQSLHLDEKNVRWSNGHTHQPRLSNGFLQLDNQNYRYSPPDGFHPSFALHSMHIEYNSMDDVIGRVYLMAKNQHGCRLLQRKFTEGSQQDINNIFLEIICHIVELMAHPFGNYFIQKLLELCNEEQMTLILSVITRTTGELFRISCDIHGTRSVQKLIEILKTPEHASMVLSCLEPDIVLLMKNINGNHVAQRCFQYLSKYSKHLMDTVISHCIELAKDRQGCCVLQTCLIHSDGEQKKRLMTKISSCSLLLSKDPYGNYVIQFILDLNDSWTTATVLNQLKGNYEHLSMQKYSSNVVEKCLKLKLAGENKCVQIIEELMISPRLRKILQDKYGNYVMQSALSESKAYGDLHVDLMAAIRRHASALRNSPYGKKVLSSASFSKEHNSDQ